MIPIWSEEEQKRVKEYLTSEKGKKEMGEKINKICDEMRRKSERRRQEEILWWHKVKDIPLTI